MRNVTLIRHGAKLVKKMSGLVLKKEEKLSITLLR